MPRAHSAKTDVGCSVARSIEVTMVGTLDRSRLPRSAIMAPQVQSTDVFLCYQRLRVSCALSRQLGQGRQRSGGSPLFMINHSYSLVDLVPRYNRLLDAEANGHKFVLTSFKTPRFCCQ